MIRTCSPVLLSILILTLPAIGQYGQYSSRSLLEKKVYFIAGGNIRTATFWSLHLGHHSCKLNRQFPGEGVVGIEAEINFNLLSSGYIEGTGYGSRGKASAEAKFAVRDGDSLKVLELEDLDYIYLNGRRIKPLKSEATDLILLAEDNALTVKRMKIGIWKYDKVYKELKHAGDVDMVTAFSFTQAGVQRALAAQRKAAASN